MSNEEKQIEVLLELMPDATIKDFINFCIPEKRFELKRQAIKERAEKINLILEKKRA